MKLMSTGFGETLDSARGYFYVNSFSKSMVLSKFKEWVPASPWSRNSLRSFPKMVSPQSNKSNPKTCREREKIAEVSTQS